MTKRTGCKQLSELLAATAYAGSYLKMPRDVTPFALAKACYVYYSRSGPLRNPELELHQAIRSLLVWIGAFFVGGNEWKDEATIYAQPESPGYYLYQVLDESGKFSVAARMLWDFVLRGEAKLVYKKHGEQPEQLELLDN